MQYENEIAENKGKTRWKAKRKMKEAGTYL